MAEQASPEIRLVDLEKRYGQVRAVDRIHLEIGAGEFFSLLGPSGCGKTTTLRMIGGFETPTHGRIELRGRDITEQPPDRRPVNTVFQNYALFPHLDVGDNVAFGLRRAGVPRDDIRRRVADALDLVQMTGYERRRPGQLSGGQQQRIALARALVNRPQVLLLDEPLGALDLKLRKRLQLELKRIQLEVGITFVYVTHDQEEALTMSDRIAVMRGGRVEQVGTPEELYERPTSRFVADFVGTTNLLEATIEEVSDGWADARLVSGERCRVRVRNGFEAGDAITLSLRPEVLELRPLVEGAERNGLAARVEQVAYLGGAVQVVARTEGGFALTVHTAKAALRPSVGSLVDITFEPGEAYVLAAPIIREQEEVRP